MPTKKPKPRRNPHDGSSLDDLLRDDGILEEVEAAALKRAVALELGELMAHQGVPKTALARQMRTSRAAVDRLLDPDHAALTLGTLTRAAGALGCRVRIEFVPA